MKKYFVTGLVLLLPLAMTIAILVFIVNFFTNPFTDLVRDIFERYGLLQKGFLFLSAYQLQLYVSKLLVLLTLFFFTVFLGILTRWVIVHYLIRFGDYIFHRIPIVRTIYKTSQDVIRTIFGSSARSFKQVVLVPFPNKETYSVGFVTKDDIPSLKENSGTTHISVFVPTTPNPTSGFLMIFSADDLIHLNMTVEDAFKYIISCGVILTPFVPLSKDQALNRIEAFAQTSTFRNK
jgi:uncharacterized membrane protein